MLHPPGVNIWRAALGKHEDRFRAGERDTRWPENRKLKDVVGRGIGRPSANRRISRIACYGGFTSAGGLGHAIGSWDRGLEGRGWVKVEVGCGVVDSFEWDLGGGRGGVGWVAVESWWRCFLSVCGTEMLVLY